LVKEKRPTISDRSQVENELPFDLDEARTEGVTIWSNTGIL